MTTPPPPRVSILLPVRDAAPFLPECIASIEAQTEARFEVLTLDDGSTDGSFRLLAAWAERDRRVRLLEPDGAGIVAALKRLARAARGPLLARMDADDIASPRRLREQIRLLEERPSVAACGTGVRYLPRPGPDSGFLRYETWLNGLTEPDDIRRDLFVECPIAHPTLMVRRDLFEGVGGYRDLRAPEDYDLVLRLDAAGHDLANVPEPLLQWRLGDHRLSLRSPRYAPEAFRRLKIRFLRRDVVPRDRPLVVWGAGDVGKAFARAWLRQVDAVGPIDPGEPDAMAVAPIPIAAFVDLDPRKIGQVIHGAPVIAPADLPEAGGGGHRPFVLAAVGAPGARAEIRAALDEAGYEELRDYRAIA